MATPKEPAKKEPEELELNITRTEIPILIEPGVYRTQYAITFWSAEIPPTTIFIWKDEWSPEKEAKAIADKIKEIREAKPKTVKIRL